MSYIVVRAGAARTVASLRIALQLQRAWACLYGDARITVVRH